MARTGSPQGTAARRGQRAGRGAVGTVRADVVDAEVRGLYVAAGWRAAGIASVLGCGTTRCYARLARMGCPAGPRRPSRPGDAKLASLCLEHGLSLRQTGSARR